MRTRLLALVSTAVLCLGAALVAVPTAQAATRPPPDQDWLPCAGPSDDYCVESATANGVPTFPGVDTTDGAVVRDYPWVKFVDAHLVIFGVWRDQDGTGGTLGNSVDPTVTYELIVRAGTFLPREMRGIFRNADYSIGTSITGGYQFTLRMQPTAVHHHGIGPGGCSVYGSCVSDSTPASWDVPGFATGDIQDLSGSGLSAREISQRTGMFRVTNAQDEDVVYDPDTDALVVRLANPHLTGAGTQVTDGTYTAFLPNAFLVGTVNVPDPAALTPYSFVVTKSYGAGSARVPISLTHEPGGVRIQIDPISFSKPTYRLIPKPKPPGKPRLTGVYKKPGSATSYFKAPLADGGRAIDAYQARCHRAGQAWKYKIAKRSPITVTSMPPGTVYCQVRAHNAAGWGPFGKAGRSRVR